MQAKPTPRSKPIPPSTPNKIVGANRHLKILDLFSEGPGLAWANDDSYGLVKDTELSAMVEASDFLYDERYTSLSRGRIGDWLSFDNSLS